MAQEEKLRILLVDDDLQVLKAYGGALTRSGHDVTTVSSGMEAAERVKSASFDVIVSDVSMPEVTGIDFLRAVRACDLDVPVILMTGEPDFESAAQAVEYGAFRYLAKPVPVKDLLEHVQRASKLHKLAQVKQTALELPGAGGARLGEKAALEVRFSWGMKLIWMAFQPIVAWPDKRIFGYEALLRSEEPLIRTPAEILDAAERLGRVHEVGRAVRQKVAAAAAEAPKDAKLFVNLHAAELNDDELYSESSPLSKIASRVILEVTERASLYDVKGVSTRVGKLKALGFQIAVDDLGAGYAGLASFTQLQPEVAKLDMSLIRGVNADAQRQSIVGSMKNLCRDLGMQVICEGVETPAERDTLTKVGCELMQGYLFAKPGRGFPTPQW